MKLPKFEYTEPDSVGHCCKLLAEYGDRARIIAGGTDLMTALKNRLKTPELLVSLDRMPDLNRITYAEKDGLSVGAMASLRLLATHSEVRGKYPMLARAALDVGSTQLQAMGTVGGNLCQDTCCLYYNRPPMWRQGLDPCHKLDGAVCHAVKGSKTCWATYCGDLAPALLALRATVKIASPVGEKVIPLNELYSGEGKHPHTLGPGQLVTEVRVPSPLPLSSGAYLKMRMRKTIDYPLLGVAVHLSLEKDKETLKDAAVGLTAVEKAPLLIRAADEFKGKKISPALTEQLSEASFEQAHPIHNTYGYTPKYRRDMVKTYVRSALHQSMERAAAPGGAA